MLVLPPEGLVLRLEVAGGHRAAKAGPGTIIFLIKNALIPPFFPAHLDSNVMVSPGLPLLFSLSSAPLLLSAEADLLLAEAGLSLLRVRAAGVGVGREDEEPGAS